MTGVDPGQTEEDRIQARLMRLEDRLITADGGIAMADAYVREQLTVVYANFAEAGVRDYLPTSSSGPRESGCAARARRSASTSG
jgi:hypothetical protein